MTQQPLTIDQRNYRRIKEDLKRSIFQRERVRDQINTLAKELETLEGDIKDSREWLDTHKEFDTPEPRYNIRTQRAAEHDPEERAWDEDAPK